MAVSRNTIGKDMLTIFHSFLRLIHYWGIYYFLNVKYVLNSLRLGNVSRRLHGDAFKWLNSTTVKL